VIQYDGQQQRIPDDAGTAKLWGRDYQDGWKPMI